MTGKNLACDIKNVTLLSAKHKTNLAKISEKYHVQENVVENFERAEMLNSSRNGACCTLRTRN